MKRITLLTLTLVLLMTFTGSICFASDTNNTQSLDQILIDFGYKADLVELINDDEKINTVKAIQSSPEKVDLDYYIVEIDEIASIEKIVNSTDEELLNEGFEVQDIQKMRKHINDFNNMSDAEVKIKYNKSDAEIKIWRIAAKKQDNYKQEEKEGTIVTTSGTISSAMLTYSQTVYDNTASTGKAVSYRAYVVFNWNNTYFWDIFSDQVVIGWGGNLATMSISHTVTYTSNNTYSWNSVVESPVNAGLKFQTYQATYDPYYSQIHNGYTGVTLYQNQKQNYDSKVLSAYGHKMLIFGAGISVSASGPSVSFSFSTGFDYSPQASSSITY